MTKIDYSNEKNWIGDKSSQSIINAKKACMESLNLLSSHHGRYDLDKINYIFKDIDLTTYALNKYLFQNSQITENKQLQKLLSNKEYAVHIISARCLPEIVNYILTKHPNFRKDIDIVKKILKASSYNLTLLQEEIKQKEIFDFIVKEKILSFDLLKIFPKNKEISILLFQNGLHPHQQVVDWFDPCIFEDTKTIKKILSSNMGYSFYYVLPEHLQEDIEICKVTQKHHPHVKVKKSMITDMNEFMKFFDEKFYPKETLATELYNICSQMQNYDFVFKNPYNILKVMEKLSDGTYSCYVDLMGGLFFSDHPMQKFFEFSSEHSKDIKNFLKTDFGKSIIETTISNYSDFSRFEQKIIPKIYDNLYNFLKINSQFETLENKLPKNKDFNNNHKI